MHIKRLVALGLLIPLLTAVAACGSSTSGGSGTGEPINDGGDGNGGGNGNGNGGGNEDSVYDASNIPAPGSAEYNLLNPSGQALIDEFLARNAGEGFDVGGLDGSATYSGTVGMVLDNAPEGQTGTSVLGDIGLTANFDTALVSGVLDSFLAYDDEADDIPITGSLTFSNGVITGSSFGAANLGGSLFNPASEEFQFTGTIEGTFLTDGAGQVIGILDGTVFDVEEGFTDKVEGIFSADRN
ncbi:hypothetical protein [Natronohydrobacter thiooxidans]|uniref:hypothetical protein n=1 Tax=Natronohydrobacter thiooxidans TaxID=87172 RepID=UPI000A9C254B|nr:hypothetical protein [Natronohydrobacter thiooxidans]